MQADYAELGEALRKILRVNLEARFVLCEIQRAWANFELAETAQRERLTRLHRYPPRLVQFRSRTARRGQKA